MPTSVSNKVDTTYGFTPLPADASKTSPSTNRPDALSRASLPIPTTPLSRRIAHYTKAALPTQTYLHSLRVYTYGRAIAAQCFPQFDLTPNSKLDETWFVTAMLHDIGTTPTNIASTKLSYEFWAGYHALDILQTTPSTASFGGTDADAVATREQAESVAEAIIRHQDVQEKGNITLVTRLIHLGTLLDNIGAGKELVHADTIWAVNEAYDRKGWSGCFADTVRQEKKLKPWTMVSRIEGFEDMIDKNGSGLMKEWET